MERKHKANNSSPIITHLEIYSDPVRKSNFLATHFENIFNSSCHKMNVTSLLIPITIALLSEDTSEYNSFIKFHELTNAILDLKMSAPGPCLIHNKMIKELPDSLLEHMLKIFNSSFINASIPTTWKVATIIPLVKPNKDPTHVESFRPISLLPCIPKLMEKIICKRLTYFLESTQAFSKFQSGFRKKMSAIDQIGRLENQVREALASKKSVVAVFIDLSKAYDTVWHTGLLYKLQKSGVRGRTLRWLKEYLTGRTFKTYFEGRFSEMKSISTGVPQGAILSPLLFNIMTNDFPQSQDVTNLEYADDFTILCSSTSVAEAAKIMEEHLMKVYHWSRDWGFVINFNKTNAMLFTRKRISYPVISINGTRIKFVPSLRYLGTILDAPKLTWNDHIQYLRESSLSKVNIMKALTRFQWGSDRHVLLKFYKSVIRGKFDYGSMFYTTAPHSKLEKLDTIQNNCLKIAIGAKKTSPTMSVEVESNIMPLKLHRKYIELKYFHKIVEFPSWIPMQQEALNTHGKLQHIDWVNSSNVPPLYIRSLFHLDLLNIDFITNETCPNFSPLKPWNNYKTIFNVSFTAGQVSRLTNDAAHIIFNSLLSTKYYEYIQIFTDGSLISDPETSAAAATIIFMPAGKIKKLYKLHKENSILGCELFAICKALEYIY